MQAVNRAGRALAILTVLTGTGLAAAPASAGESFIDLGVGYFDVARGGDDSTALFHANWHTGYDLFWTIAPFVGVSATVEGGVYGYAGLYADIMLTDHIFVMPSFAAGAFADGGGKDMGSTIEFRSSITAGYRFDGGVRVGAFYNHISNAGIDNRNPGADTAGISVSFPISLF